MNVNYRNRRPDPFQLRSRHQEGKTNNIHSKGILQEKNQKNEEIFNEEFILCNTCNHKITTRKESISVSNSHQHTFANPAGILFDIGCFKSAPGCLNTGPFTDEFSWFKGFKWRISICETCFTHLGWMFLSSTNHIFFGLILDRLIDSTHGSP